MNILLINPNCGFQTYIKSAPLGLLSIATFLKKRGYSVRMYDRKIEKLSPAKAVQGFWPDVVGVSVASVADIHDGVRISRWFRKKGIPVIWGGQFSSLVPEMILREGSADYVVIEEGEITFHELLQALENKSDTAQIKGIAYLEPSGEICRTPAREFADLADLPVIDWSFIDPEQYFIPDAEIGCKKMLCLYSSKGCSGHCAFCYNDGFHHSKCRKRPNEYVLNEIEELITKHGMDGIFFVDDDMFGAKGSDMRGFCEHIINRNLNIRWRCFTQASRYSPEELCLLRDAGCRRVFVGIESGSPEILKRMHKRVNLDTIESAIQNCNEADIGVTCGFVLGFPGETEEQLRETAQLMKRLDFHPNRLQILAHFPFPGSETYTHLVESGKLTPPSTLHEWGKYKLREDVFDNFYDVPKRDMHVLQAYFGWRGFFRKTGEKGRETARGTIGTSLRNIFQQNFFHMIQFVFSSAKYFLTIAWYAHAYPGIRRKYGLD